MMSFNVRPTSSRVQRASGGPFQERIRSHQHWLLNGVRKKDTIFFVYVDGIDVMACLLLQRQLSRLERPRSVLQHRHRFRFESHGRNDVIVTNASHTRTFVVVAVGFFFFRRRIRCAFLTFSFDVCKKVEVSYRFRRSRNRLSQATG